LLLTGLLLACALLAVPSLSDALIGMKEGDRPRDFRLDDLNGNTVSLDRYLGKKPVILVFWELAMSTSFLDYSLDELRYLNALYKKEGGEKLEILALYTPEEEGSLSPEEMERVKTLMKVHDLRFPVLIDSGFRTFREYGVIALPTTVMIGKQGTIEFIFPSFPLAAQPLFTEQIMDLLGQGGTDAARKAPDKREQDTHAVRLYNYALQMYKRGLYEQALSPLRKSLEIDAGQFRPHNLMGILLWQKGSFEAAQNAFRASMKSDEKEYLPRYNYGVVLYESGRYSEAEKYLKEVLALDATLAELHYILGLIHKKTENEEAAVKELEQALSIFDKQESGDHYQSQSLPSRHRIAVLYELSDLYLRKGLTERSLELLQRAVRLALGLAGSAEGAGKGRSIDLMIYE
jgi:Tfp pilus assembly protein PilF/peroxiredoxin